MTWQEPTLFDPPYQAHSDTSKAAAEAIKPHVPTMRDKVLACILQYPGTDQEIAHRLGIPENSARPRRVELERAGLVRAVNKKQTSAGRTAYVWGPT
jgi:predicted ArsR family transcriptional regulator